MKKTTLLIILCTFLLAACASVGLAGPTPTPTVDSQATANALEAEQAQKTQDALATTDAINATAEAEVTSVALTDEAANATPTLSALNVRRTEDAGQAFGILQSLYDGNFITTTQGNYIPLTSFVDAEAKINYFDWTFTDYSPGDFVFRSNIAWESASESANWFNSGCGIVFREALYGAKFYVVFLNLDGNVELFEYDNQRWRNITSKYYGMPDVPIGGAELLVTAEGEHIQVFVDSKLIIDVQDPRDPPHLRGGFGFTVSSGTNKDFGTRCSFTDIVLWELKAEK